MSHYKIDVTGGAAIQYRNEDGEQVEKSIRDEVVEIPEPPRIVSDGPIDIEIEETAKTIATYTMPSDALDPINPDEGNQ